MSKERTKAIERADKLFSELIRRSRSNIDGITSCYTCGKKMHWKDITCGHFASRKNLKTRWDIENAEAQCMECNSYKSGNIEVFEQRLRGEFGDFYVDDLIVRSKSVVRLDAYDINQLADELKQKIKDDEEQRRIRYSERSSEGIG